MPNRSTHEQAMILFILRALHITGKSHLWLVLLDLQKAFDSLDHATGLKILHDCFNLNPEWIEVMRRFLSDNTTTILGTQIPVTQGSGQGSPLSPLFCVLFLESLARRIHTHLEAYPHDWSTFPCLPSFQPGVIEPHRLLLLLLLFADDIALLGSCPSALQRLLDAITTWANDHFLKFSKKSNFLLLHATPSLYYDHRPPPFRIQDVTLELEREIGRYLGHPLRPYQPHQNPFQPYPIDETQASKILTSLHDLFHLPDGRPQVNVSLLRTAIQQVIHNKFLYPSPVLDVDYAALDSLILRTLARTLTLPPNTPSSYVLHHVGILPSHLVAHERALRFVHTFTHTWFWRIIIEPHLTPQPNHTALSKLFDKGPLARLTSLLTTYRSHLGAWPVRDPFEGWRSAQCTDKATWWIKVHIAIRHANHSYHLTKLSSYPPAYQSHLRQVLTVYGDPSTPQIPPPRHLSKHLGDLRHSAIRFLAVSLRYHYRHEPLPACAWCRKPACESGLHFLRCPSLPPPFPSLLAQSR